MRAVIITQPDNKLRNTIRHTRVHHCLTDSKSTGNSNQNIPRNIFSIFTGREQIRPCHNNSSNRHKEKHIQFDIRKHLLRYRKLTHRCADNHQHQQQQSKPTLLLPASIRFIPVCQQDKHRRFPPRRDKSIISHHNKRIPFMKYHIVQVSDEALSVTCLDLFYLCTIMTLEIKILQFFIDTGKTGTQNSLYPMQLLPFFYFFIRHSRIRTCIRQKTFREKKYINDTGNSYKNTHLSELEHRKAFKSGLQYHTVHHQIGRSTDQGTDTSQNSHIRKRNQKLRSREIHRLSPMLDNRGKNNHNRRIIQKGRNKCHRR